jgi:hypothetical protein
MAQLLDRGALLLEQVSQGQPHSVQLRHDRMTTLRLVLGDQLSRAINASQDIDRNRDVVLKARRRGRRF